LNFSGSSPIASNSWTVAPDIPDVDLYEVRPRKDHRGVDLISDALPFGRVWYGAPNAASNAVGYAKFFGRSHDAVIRVFDETGNVIETHEHAGDFKEP
jgi:hypothetical protein